jgi:hypothetical protein
MLNVMICRPQKKKSCLHCIFYIIFDRGISYPMSSIYGSNHSHKPYMFRSLVIDICVHGHHIMIVNLVEVEHSESHTSF